MSEFSVSIRDVEITDKDSMLEWRNSESVRPYMYNDKEISESEHESWFSKMLDDKNKKYFIIELDMKPVGVVNLTNISEENKIADWAFYLFSPSVRGKGVGSFVEKYILKYFFEDMAYEKLNCEVLDINMPVVRMHEKFGFKQEGYFRSMYVRDGARIGVYRLGMTKEDYLYSIKEKTQLEKDLDVITKIQNIRSKNNINWMDVLRLSLKLDPIEAKKIIKNINGHDDEISQLVQELSN